MQSELSRIRAEIQELERSVPENAPLWIGEKDVAERPELSDEDVFDLYIEDRTPGIPDFVYDHVMSKLAKMAPDEIEKQSAGDFPYDAAQQEPASYRGRVWRITGWIPSKYRAAASPSCF